MAGERFMTRDHDVIRKWVEDRGGKPSTVGSTRSDDDAGIIRIDFPGYSGEDTLEEIPWDEWFEKFDDSELSGTIKASYRLNPSILTYVSYARGYKSFGYNLDRVQAGITPVASTLFPSEVVDSYEAGVKMTLLDRTLLLNATYFDQVFNDFQLNTFLGTAFVVESIPELTSRGVDADFLWFSPIEGLSFQGGVTWTDAQYGEFTAADLANPSNFPQLSLLPGGDASFAPEWSGTLAINFDRNIRDDVRYVEASGDASI